MSAPTGRKTSTVKIVPIQPSENGAVKDPHTFQIPKLKEVPKTEAKLQSREIKVPITITHKPKETPIQVHIDTAKRPSQGEVKVEQPVLRKVSVEQKKPPVQEPVAVREVKKQEGREAPVLRETKKKPEVVPMKQEEPELDKVSFFG